MPIATAQAAQKLLTPNDHTLIMIDHQSQMAFATRSIDLALLRNNAALVAKAAL
ncbi:MAG: hydrolase, partial [Janthinobacterium sp.]